MEEIIVDEVTKQMNEIKINDTPKISKKLTKNEVQKHGFIWEENICKKVYKVSDKDYESISYTSKMDIPKEYNNLNNTNVSIKTSKNINTICMSDPKNLYNKVNSKEPYNLCIIMYNQIEDKKILQEIFEINLTDSCNILFRKVTIADIIEFENKVKTIPKNRSPTNDEKKQLDILQKQLQQKSGIIKFNRKIDSKEQRRLQCSINKFQNFIKEHNKLIVNHSRNNIFYGCEVIKEILSSPRIFN